MSRTLQVLLTLLIATAFSSCRLKEASDSITEVSADIPLSEFVIGSWSTEHVYMPNGEEENYLGFDVTFRDQDTVEVVVKENGDPMDITISQYSYVDSDTIYIDNKRLHGGEIWHLERDAQKLIVRITVDEDKEGPTLIFTRSS
jgi:hypothetical protein